MVNRPGLEPGPLPSQGRVQSQVLQEGCPHEDLNPVLQVRGLLSCPGERQGHEPGRAPRRHQRRNSAAPPFAWVPPSVEEQGVEP
jgi:hypothetical protein